MSNLEVTLAHFYQFAALMSSEKFCLKWNDFQENIDSSFNGLREEMDFSDVTLVCKDDKEIEAHRVILSACSDK